MGEGQSPAPQDPTGTTRGVIEATMGGFAMRSDKARWGICCCSHGNMGLFYAWDGILRHTDSAVQVNLLLNRTSPCRDPDLPLYWMWHSTDAGASKCRRSCVPG